MKQLTTHKYFKPILILWVACILICLVIFLLVWQPRHLLTSNTRVQAEQKEKEYEAIVESTTPASQAILQNNMKEALDRLNAFAVELGQSSELPLDISRVGGQIPLDKFSSQSKTEKAFMEIPNCVNIGEQYIEVTFKGSFNQFAIFLNAMERFRPIIFVDRFKINKARRSAINPDEHEVNMTLAVLVRKQVPDSAPAAKAESLARNTSLVTRHEPAFPHKSRYMKVF